MINEFNPSWNDLSIDWHSSTVCHAELDSASHLTNETMRSRITRHNRYAKRSGRESGMTSQGGKGLTKIRIGKLGEQIAAKYLINHGYQILATNFYTAEGEIDLVCQKNNVIIFVEVKTRTNHNFGWPEESVTDQKLERIAVTAEKYLDKSNLRPEWQIDILAIIIDKKKKLVQLKHIKNTTLA